jgi:hypothetical protein
MRYVEHYDTKNPDAKGCVPLFWPDRGFVAEFPIELLIRFI